MDSLARGDTATGLAVLDADGRIAWHNPRWRALVGPHAGVGASWTIWLAGADRAVAEAVFRRAMSGRNACGFESPIEGRTLQIGVEVTGGPAPTIVAFARELPPPRTATAAPDGAAALQEQLHESDERFRSAFECAGIGMALASRAGRFLAVNRSFCELLGYTEAELLARDIQAITHPDDLGLDIEYAADLLMSRRRSYQLEKRYIHRDGHVVWVMLTSSVVRAPDGSTKHFLGQIEDITARKQALAELSLSEARHRALIEAADDAIAAASPSGEILFVNGAASRALAVAPADLIGRSLEDLLPEDARERWLAAFATVVATRRPLAVEPELPGPDGPRSFQTKLVPVLDATGTPSMVLALGRDVTDARRAEAERAAIAERAEKAQRLDSLGVLAGGVAHDLNNLLTVVQGWVDVARTDRSGRNVATALEQIEGAAQQAAELARRLLAVAGAKRKGAADLGLDALVRDTVRMLRPTLPAGVDVRLDLAPAATHGDEGQIRQAVMNLLWNAIEAVGGRGTITVTTGVREAGAAGDSATVGELPAGPYATVAVRDDGPGIPEEIKRRLFEPFFSTKASGRGLGLAVVHGVARAHQGGVQLDSAPGHGTQIAVLLPAARSAPEPVRAPAPERFVGRGHVLVVDDEPMIRGALTRLIGALGFQVTAVDGGAAALQRLAEAGPPFDLVVLDLFMPVVDGFAVFEALRKQHPRLPVIVSSGYSGTQGLARLQGEPNLSFLPKPYGLGELRAALREALGDAGALPVRVA